jgi:hypothetical protein
MAKRAYGAIFTLLINKVSLLVANYRQHPELVNKKTSICQFIPIDSELDITTFPRPWPGGDLNSFQVELRHRLASTQPPGHRTWTWPRRHFARHQVSPCNCLQRFATICNGLQWSAMIANGMGVKRATMQ